eukprot:COSAG06_NODE_13944_length_1203_cov_1.897645_1_plen_31_part_10
MGKAILCKQTGYSVEHELECRELIERRRLII